MSDQEPETVVTLELRAPGEDGRPGDIVGSVGRYGEQWWGSAYTDVRNFDSEAEAEAWVREVTGIQVGGAGGEQPEG